MLADGCVCAAAMTDTSRQSKVPKRNLVVETNFTPTKSGFDYPTNADECEKKRLKSDEGKVRRNAISNSTPV